MTPLASFILAPLAAAAAFAAAVLGASEEAPPIGFDALLGFDRLPSWPTGRRSRIRATPART